MIHYSIRENARSTRASLKITPHEGLVVVIPPRYNQNKIESLLREKREWIEKHLPHYENAKQQWQHQEEQPSTLTLNATGETWNIQYGNQAACIEGEQNLQLHHSVWPQLLRKWLQKKAKRALTKQLEQISEETDLPYKKSSIRNQKSRWGSCSSTQEISLNMKLLFLPPHLVRHVMVHELAHTIHLNHSSEFWALVEKHDPNYKKHNAELKEALFFVPHWLQTENVLERKVLTW